MRGLIGEDMGCEIELDNSGELYTDRFDFRDIITLKYDFGNGTTLQWEGELEEQQKKVNDAGYILLIRGSHYTSKLLDVTVNASFTDAEASSVLTSIVGDFLTGFTTTNVNTTTTNVTIVWNNKPLFDCIIDLMQLADFDCYVDNSKDFHFFKKGSIPQDNDRLVDDDNMFELRGIGEDNVDVRNRTIIYGDSDGLPVISTSDDTSSQTTHGVKEKVIKDTSINDEDQAQAIGDAENELNKSPPVKGTADSFLIPELNPGDMLYVIHPPQNLHDRCRVISFIMKFPEETLETNFSKHRTIPKIFKERQQQELRQEDITNPFQMEHSFNFSFDDETKIDSSASDNVGVEEGQLFVSSGSNGKMVSITKDTADTITAVHLKVLGDNISGNTYRVSADGGSTFQAVIPEEETTISTQGTKLKLEVNINSADARLDAAAVLYK